MRLQLVYSKRVSNLPTKLQAFKYTNTTTTQQLKRNVFKYFLIIIKLMSSSVACGTPNEIVYRLKFYMISYISGHV